MTRLKLVVLPVTAVVLLSVVGVALAGKAPSTPTPDPRFFPDLRTVVPQHLNLVNQGQEEYLRFSNGIANTGPGPWALRAEHDFVGTLTTTAYQEIRTSNAKYQCGTQPKQVTACYEVQSDRVASIFEYHPTHNHWHTADAARFEVRKGSPTGPLAEPAVGQGRLLPDRDLPPRRATRPRASAPSGTATAPTRASAAAGWTSTTRPPTASRSRSPA